MAEVRRTDPATRRQAVVFIILAAVVGTLLIAAFERYRTPLRDWLLSEPEQLERRVKVGLFLITAVFVRTTPRLCSLSLVAWC